MRSVIRDLTESPTKLDNDSNAQFELVYPGRKTLADDRRMDVCLFKLLDDEFNISDDERSRLVKIFTRLAGDIQQVISKIDTFDRDEGGPILTTIFADELVNTLYKSLEGDFSCVAESIFLDTKKYCEIFWSEPTVELIYDASSRTTFFASFKIGNPPSFDQLVHEKVNHSELDIIQILNDEPKIKEVDLENREERIYLTSSNPIQFRSAFKSAIIQKWNNRFEKASSVEKKKLIKNIQHLLDECDILSFPASSLGLDYLIDRLLYKSKPYVVCKNSGNQHGFNWKIISSVIDNVYLTLDPSILTLAGQNFPRLTWESYALTMEYESQILQARNLHGGLSPLYYPSNYFQANGTHLIECIQKKLNVEFSKSPVVLKRLMEVSERFLFRLVLSIADAAPNSFDTTDSEVDDYLDSTCKFWRETFFQMLNFDVPILPLETHLTYSGINRRLNQSLSYSIDPVAFANVAFALHEFKDLPAKKRNGLTLRVLTPFISEDMINNGNYYKNSVTTKIRMEFLLNNIVSPNFVTLGAENSYFLRLLNDNLKDNLIEVDGEHFELSVSTINIETHSRYQNIELNTDFNRKVGHLYLNFKSKKRTLRPIEYTSYRSGQALSVKDASTENIVKTLLTKVDDIFKYHPILSSILLGEYRCSARDVFNPMVTRDSWFPISPKGVTFTQSTIFLKSLMYGSQNSIELIPSIIRNMRDPYHISANGKSILDIAIVNCDPESLHEVYGAYKNMGANDDFFDRSFDTAIATYDTNKVEIALRHSSGISENYCDSLYKWGVALNPVLESLIRNAKMKYELKNCALNQKNMAPQNTKKRSLDIL